MFLASVLIVLFVFKSPLNMLDICHCQLSLSLVSLACVFIFTTVF